MNDLFCLICYFIYWDWEIEVKAKSVPDALLSHQIYFVHQLYVNTITYTISLYQ